MNSRFVGEYHSVFKGQGMEFSEVREYQPGDEVRTIDWNVSARMRRLFVKRYVEERELTVLLIVDCSGSSRFGTGERDKQAMAAELAAVLALTATRNNDRVGLILCSDRIEHVVPPRKGRRHALRLVRDVLAWPTTSRGTNLALALEYASRVLTPPRARLRHLRLRLGADGPAAQGCSRSGTISSRWCSTIPASARCPISASRGSSIRRPAASWRSTRARRRCATRYGRELGDERAARQQLLRRLAIDEVLVRTETGYAEPLLRFFNTRETRGRKTRRR